ncbi:MAG: radical SAM family heme chaperone HemW [Rhodospirillaceae bacterium]
MTDTGVPAPTGDRPDGPLGVYVHWPFCKSKCPYCDFNSHVPEGSVDQALWADALIADLTDYARDTPGRTVETMFFGGGTPSLMAPETVARVIAWVKSLWPTAPGMEISLEANPTSVETETLPALKAAGITRLSLGIQAFNDADLATLGRTHSAKDALKALELAKYIFQEYSFDLIYARSGQTESGWREELTQALEHAGPHLSFYQLTIESGTPFHRDGVEAADDDTGAVLYDATQEILDGAGLPAYEISNHARPGHECRHNLNIWRGWDYVGVGPGAHGRLCIGGDNFGTHQIHNPERWLQSVLGKGHGGAKRRSLKPEDRATERIMMGLRLGEGIDRARFRAQTGEDVTAYLDADAVRQAADGGYLDVTGDCFRATADGRLRLNGLLARIIA